MIKKLFSIWLFCIALIGNAYSQQWQSFGINLSHPPRCFYTDTTTNNNALYIGGEFTNVNNILTNHILKWDGLNFQPIGNNLGIYSGVAQIWSITKFDGSIYMATGNPWLSKWDGSQWDTLGLFNTGIVSLYTYNNELCAGGPFIEVDGISANSIAKWDGSQWHSLNFPYSSRWVLSMVDYKGELYIGGNIEDSTGNIVCCARYDGTNWNWLGNGLRGFYAGVTDMVVYKGELYVAGSFSKTDYAGNPGNYIAKWDGSNWSDVGGGVMGISGYNGQINDLQIYHDELYAIGVFSFAGGVPAQFIAKWNGERWCGLGTDFGNSSVTCLGVFQDILYVGGSFLTINGDSINNLAKWTGGSYVDTCSTPSGIQEFSNSLNELNVYPNPFSNYTILKSSKPLQNATLSIYDVLGKEVKRLQNLNGTEIIINREDINSGMYFYDLIDSKGLIGRGKMIVE